MDRISSFLLYGASCWGIYRDTSNGKMIKIAGNRNCKLENEISNKLKRGELWCLIQRLKETHSMPVANLKACKERTRRGANIVYSKKIDCKRWSRIIRRHFLGDDFLWARRFLEEDVETVVVVDTLISSSLLAPMAPTPWQNLI